MVAENGKPEHWPEAELGNDIVYSIAGGRDGLWIGRQRGGLTLLRTTSHSRPAHSSLTFTASWRTFTTAQGLAQNSVYSVYESHDGSVWAGTLSGGVSRLSNGRFTNFTKDQGLRSNTIDAIAETSDGTMWFATPNGLSAFSDSHWRTLGVRDGLPSENINCLLVDSGNIPLDWHRTGPVIVYRGRSSFTRQYAGIASRADPGHCGRPKGVALAGNLRACCSGEPRQTGQGQTCGRRPSGICARRRAPRERKASSAVGQS